jgi:hypothetical protein
VIEGGKMNKNDIRLALCMFLLSIPIFLFSGNIRKTVYFNQIDMQMYKLNGNDMIKMKNCIDMNIPGYPILPVLPAKVLLPQGAIVKSVKIVNINSTDIGKNYLIQPAGKPQIISHPKYEKIEPNKQVYESKDFYPGNIVQYSGQGYKDGFNIANLIIYPLQYAGYDGRLRFANSITIDIDYDINMSNIKYERDDVVSIVKGTILKMIINPEDMDIYRPYKSTYISKNLYYDTIPYVIITTPEFECEMEPLAEWKTKKGLKAKIITLDFIYNHYYGNDNPDRIRNFIIDAHNSWGTMYIVLGGQCDFENGEEIVPRRDAYYMILYNTEVDTVISDLYYGDLDGNWDYNGNSVYGEVGDSVDLYTDVYVGRAPFKNATQAQTFVNKTLIYEKNIPQGYVNSTILPAVELFSWYNFWGDTVNNILADITPSPWIDNKLYESLGNLSREAVTNALNSGTGYIHYACHGNEYGTYFAHSSLNGDTVSNINDIDILTNGDKLGVYFSIACLSGAFDLVPEGDCFAEHIINNPNGGGVISMFNSRFGIGYPPDLGPSEVLDTLYLSGLFDNNCKTHGEAISFAKDYVVPIAIAEGDSLYYRYCMYGLNTLGDPEIHPFTSEVGYLKATYSDSIFSGYSQFSIHIEDSLSSIPIEYARVCIMRDSAVYVTGLTDISGYVDYKITDDTNNNGIINPGEDISLDILLKNFGCVNSPGVYAKLSSDDTLVSITSDSSFYGQITAGDSLWNQDAFTFSVSSLLPDNYILNFIINIRDSLNNEWTNPLKLIANKSEIEFGNLTIDDSITGNGNNIWDRNEQVKLVFVIKNMGGDTAKNVNLSINIANPDVTINDSISYYGNILPNSIAQNDSDAIVATSSLDIPTGCIIWLKYKIQGDNFSILNDSVKVKIGLNHYIVFDIDPNHSSGTIMDSIFSQLGYSGDYDTKFSTFINSLDNYYSVFIFAGIFNNKTIIDQTNGSKIASWCNNKNGNLYIEGGDVWCWDPFYGDGYNFNDMFGISTVSDGYGDLSNIEGAAGTITDGMSFVYSGENSFIDRINPTGSGYNIFNNTSPVYGCGVANNTGIYRTIGLSFEFAGLMDGSGMSTKEALADSIMHFFGIQPQGVAIDRFNVLKNDRTLSFGIKAKGSNLFSNKLDIEYGIVHSGKVEIEIYNTTGRKIRTLVNISKNAGYHRISWNGKDDNGKNLVNGIYFVTIKSAGKVKNTKVMLIK